jgi:hypothetical protein
VTATIPLYARTEALNILDGYIAEHADEIAANGGALPEEIEALLADADGEFAEKVEAVALYIRSLKASAIAVATERDRLGMKLKALDNTAEWLTRYLKINLEAAGKTEVKGTLANVRIQQSSPSVTSVLDSAALGRLHAAYADMIEAVPETYKLKAAAVIAAHKAGRALPNGVIVTRGNHVVIR